MTGGYAKLDGDMVRKHRQYCTLHEIRIKFLQIALHCLNSCRISRLDAYASSLISDLLLINSPHPAAVSITAIKPLQISRAPRWAVSSAGNILLAFIGVRQLGDR